MFPKRCGHLEGKQLISIDNMQEKLQFACEARKLYSKNEFIVCARTDARGVLGLEEAIHRAKKYIDAKVDMIFPEGL